MSTIAAYDRFLASSPQAQREIRTIEISHPDLSQVFRFAQDYNDLTATLEDLTVVTFTAATLEITEPAERNDSEQNLQIKMGAVSDELQDIIDQITDQGFLTELKIVYRKYYSEDLTQPAATPLILFGSTISFEGSESVSFVAEDTDLSNKRSGQLYTLTEFPGLESV